MICISTTPADLLQLGLKFSHQEPLTGQMVLHILDCVLATMKLGILVSAVEGANP